MGWLRRVICYLFGHGRKVFGICVFCDHQEDCDA